MGHGDFVVRSSSWSSFTTTPAPAPASAPVTALARNPSDLLFRLLRAWSRKVLGRWLNQFSQIFVRRVHKSFGLLRLAQAFCPWQQHHQFFLMKSFFGWALHSKDSRMAMGQKRVPKNPIGARKINQNLWSLGLYFLTHGHIIKLKIIWSNFNYRSSEEQIVSSHAQLTCPAKANPKCPLKQ